MASITKKLTANVEGNFYVDSTCIDCETCRWLAHDIFSEDSGQSYVKSQPTTIALEKKAIEALLACPTSSIGMVERSTHLKEIRESFPTQIEDNVYYCGYHSEKSYGAASYLIIHPEGNVMIDCPRFSKPLVNRIESLGGIALHFLTHQDDVADHELYHRHFNSIRIIHKDDTFRNAKEYEQVLEGEEAVKLHSDITIIPVPGHTKGSCALHYQKFLFTGDHLAWSPEKSSLYAFRYACWYSWQQQCISMTKLLDYSFEWVLPGHGYPHHATEKEMNRHLNECIVWMKSK